MLYCRFILVFTALFMMLACPAPAQEKIRLKEGQRLVFLPFHSEVKGRNFLKTGLASMLASRVARRTSAVAVAGRHMTKPLSDYLRLDQQKSLYALMDKMHGDALVVGDITPAHTEKALLISVLVFTRNNRKKPLLFHRTVAEAGDIAKGIDMLAWDIAATAFGVEIPADVAAIKSRGTKKTTQKTTAVKPENNTNPNRYEIINPERAWREGLYNHQ